jgi:small-conductance mechanosensitive channel
MMTTPAWPRRPFYLFILLFCLFVLGVGAVGGGFALAAAPDGSLLGMPLSMLEHSPFKNFFGPGLILAVLLGIYPLTVFYGLLRRPKWKWAAVVNLHRDQHWSLTHALYVGLILILWMDFQIFFIGYGSLIQALYALFGVLIAVLALLPPLRTYYKHA